MSRENLFDAITIDAEMCATFLILVGKWLSFGSQYAEIKQQNAILSIGTERAYSVCSFNGTLIQQSAKLAVQYASNETKEQPSTQCQQIFVQS